MTSLVNTPRARGAALRFLIYFGLALGWFWLYVRNPELTSNAPFVYQDF